MLVQLQSLLCTFSCLTSFLYGYINGEEVPLTLPCEPFTFRCISVVGGGGLPLVALCDVDQRFRLGIICTIPRYIAHYLGTKFSLEGGKGAERPLPTTTKKKKRKKKKKKKKPPDTISEHLEFKIFLGGHAPRPPYIGGLCPHPPPPPPSSDSLWRIPA